MLSCYARSRSRGLLQIILGLFFVTETLSAQSPDYKAIFGDNWKKAEQFVAENREWMQPAIEKSGIPYPEAIAVIFPELVRYSALRDRIEISLLKTLYINLGEEYANFSIGAFQMKPSFAEKIRSRTSEIKDGHIRHIFRKKSNYKSVREMRASIVADLEDPRQQLNYLIAFIEICNSGFKLPEGEERIQFLATAYNYDFTRTEAEINQMENARFFTTRLFKTENYYSYSDVSLFWYKCYLSGTEQ